MSNSGTTISCAHFSLSNTKPPGSEPSGQRVAGKSSGSRGAGVPISSSTPASAATRTPSACAASAKASPCMSSWNSARRNTYSAASSSPAASSSSSVRSIVSARYWRVDGRSGNALDQRSSRADCAGSQQRSASGSMAARRGALGSPPAPRWRCTLRPTQRSWNQPMWPAIHSGGSTSRCGVRAHRSRPSASSNTAIQRSV